MNTFYVMPSNYDLMHHGVKGQKWGVRRYQNEDGSLTNAGRRKELRGIEKNRNRDLRAMRKENRFNFSKQREDAKNINLKYDKQRVDTARNEKEKFKEYRKVFLNTGLPGSYYDEAYYNRYGSKWDREIRKAEGEKYANEVLKSARNRTLTDAGIMLAAGIGLTAVSVLLDSK